MSDNAETISAAHDHALGSRILDKLLSSTSSTIVAGTALIAALITYDDLISKLLNIENSVYIIVTIVTVFTASLVVSHFIRKREQSKFKLKIGTPIDKVDADYFQLSPYRENSAERYNRLDNADKNFLLWFIDANQSIVHLSGMSGVGKSSLLDASFRPNMKKQGTEVINLRCFDQSLVEELRKKRKNNCVIIIDQFEEIFSYPDSKSTASLIEAINFLERSNPKELRLILVWRSDYQASIFGCGIPIPTYPENWFLLSPYGQPDAIEFLKTGKPDLTNEQLSKVLKGLDQIEDADGLYRHITLNMVGKVLSERRFEIGNDTSSLLQNYLKTSIRRSPMDENNIRKILATLITSGGQRTSKTIHEIIAETSGIDWAQVAGTLADMQNRGLVRYTDQNREKWEISHDFVASILAQLILAYRPPLKDWLVKIGLPISMIGTSVALVFGAPFIDRYNTQQTMLSLSNAGISVDGSEMSINTSEPLSLEFYKTANNLPLVKKLNFNRIPKPWVKDLLRILPNIDEIVIGDEKNRENIESFGNLEFEESEDYSIDDFSNLILEKSFASKITSISVNLGFSDFDITALSNASRLRWLQIEDAAILGSLSARDLQFEKLEGLSFNSVSMNDASFIKNMRNIRYLSLQGVINKFDVNFLGGLKEVEELSISPGIGVKRLRGLSNLKKLKKLHLIGFVDLVDLSELAGLDFLEDLSLKWGKKINVDEFFQKMKHLEKLVLDGVDRSSRIVSAFESCSIQTLSIRFVQNLETLLPFSNCSKLQEVDLFGSYRFADVKQLNNFPEIKFLNIGFTDVSGDIEFPQLDKLANLNISQISNNLNLLTLSVNREELTTIDANKTPNLSISAAFQKDQNVEFTSSEKEFTSRVELLGNDAVKNIKLYSIKNKNHWN